MSTVNGMSYIQTIVPDNVNLHILSFLGKEDIRKVGATCQKIHVLSKNAQVYKQLTFIQFGKLIAQEKPSQQTWEYFYKGLEASKQSRTQGIEEVLQSHIKKVALDDLHFRTNRAAALQLLGFPMPNTAAHYYPTGQIGYLGSKKFIVYKST